MNVITSPKDERDYSLSMATDIAGVDIPEQFEVWQPPIENQGSVGNCVAQSLANIMECIEYQKTKKHKDYSVGYIYGTSDTRGMIPRKACSVLCKDGDIHRDIWECLKENPACHNALMEVKDGLKQYAVKPLEYIRLQTKEELQRFMLKYNLPVMIIIPMNGENHAVACRGWRNAQKALSTKDIHYTNSYGTGGNKFDGTAWIEFDEIKEIWGIVPMAKKYKDVESNRWSANAINELSDIGIITGFEDGTFCPNEPLSREQAAALLQRLLRYIEGNFQKE